MPLKLLLIEDIQRVRQDINSFVNSEENPVYVYTKKVEDQFNAIRENNTEIIVFSSKGDSGESLDFLKNICSTFPAIKVVMLTLDSREKFLASVMAAGAKGYIFSSSGCAELLQAVKKIKEGQIYVDSRFTLKIRKQYNTSTDSAVSKVSVQPYLNEKEVDVLLLVAEGFTNAQIANKLYTSIRTIETRRKNLLDKTGTTNTATLIKYAVRNGFV